MRDRNLLYCTISNRDNFAYSSKDRISKLRRGRILPSLMKTLGSAIAIGATFTAAHAEEAAERDSDPTSIVVTGKRMAEEQTSATGLSLSVLDTPRTVTTIDASQLRDAGINSVLDISKLVPSSYTSTQFGGANIPELRGQSAEVFENGILRTTRSNGLPVSFNAVAGLDVVKGPAGVVYGPTGNVGGYVNLVTKKASFDGFQGKVNLSYGSWDDKRGQIDLNLPLGENLAARISYERIDADSYYRLGYMDSHDIYGTIRWEPNDRLSIDANIEYYHAKFNENTGINRPTQELVSDGIYYTGTGVGPFSSPSDPRGFLAVIDVTGEVKIDRSFQLVGTDDFSRGSDLTTQLVVDYKLNDSLTLTSRSSYESYSQTKVENAQRYYNYIPESDHFQTRLELTAKIGPHQIIGGLAYKHISLLSYSDFYNEYLNATDITTDPSTYSITSVFGVVQVPGRPAGEFAAPGAAYGAAGYPYSISGTRDENSSQKGVFLQGLFNLTGNISLLVGGRLDRIHEELKDPLPPPGVTPAQAEASGTLAALNGSITFKPNAGTTLYATVNYNESAVVTGGGGFAGFSGTAIQKSNFNVQNYLYEAGAKFAMLDSKLYLSSSIYSQQRSLTDTFGTTNKVQARGVEFQGDLILSPSLSATASYSYLDAKLVNAQVSAFTGDVYDAFAPPYGNGTGSPNFRALPVKDYRVPGYPQHLINAFARYSTPFGLGFSAGIVVTGPMYTSYLETVRIPWQHQFDASVYFEKDDWKFYADFYNITAQKNWSPNGAASGNDLITANLPFHVKAGVIKSF